jgi:hypothetical protein
MDPTSGKRAETFMLTVVGLKFTDILPVVAIRRASFETSPSISNCPVLSFRVALLPVSHSLM